MDKNLTVFPIANGNTLNVYAKKVFYNIRILDIDGNEVYQQTPPIPVDNQHIDIKKLPQNTYIAEVIYTDNTVARSVFVKI